MNRLAHEKSPYLRHAASQKIDWYPWSDAVFARARLEDKPVFLSTGAVWCHWCHVMARECFENEEVVRLLNELFICVKLDRDERPDIDRRYQQAVNAMGGGSGWPLSAFLTPAGKIFYGGTYFPPEDRHGRPGFKKVLAAVHQFYRSQKKEAEAYADQVMATLRADRDEQASPLAVPPQEAVDKAVEAMLAQHDARHGGFGDFPKFPQPGAMEFLLHRAARADHEQGLAPVLRQTLFAMAQGGFHDQLGGGFHRYSVDAAWIVPHFEKMADDNAWLLRNYIDAFAVFGDARLKAIALGIISFSREVLSDPAGGFFASQDADVSPADEGGYFTWTREDFQAALSREEEQVLARYFLDERGSMPHDPARHVLFVAVEAGEVAAALNRPEEEVRRLIESGKEKLLAARRGRATPFIDTTKYTSLNGMFISSYLRAFRVLHDPFLKEFAIKSLDLMLHERFQEGRLEHAAGVPAMLDDYVYLAEACVAAYEVTGEMKYRAGADDLMQRCLQRHQDEAGGFFDTEQEVLGTRLKHIEDVPHPSPNALAVMLLLKLHRLTGNPCYAEAAEKTLAFFAATAAEIGVHAGSYFGALDAWFSMIKLTVEAPGESELAQAARSLVGCYTTLLYGAADKGRILPCRDVLCGEPVHEPGALAAAVRQMQRNV